MSGKFRTIDEAQEKGYEAIKQVKQDMPVNRDNITVGQLVKIYRTLHMKNLARNTRVARESFFKNHILPFMGRQKISSLHKVIWLKLIAHLEKKGLAPNSVRDIMQVMKALFNWAEENEVIASNPFYKSKLSKGGKVKHTNS